MVLKQYLRIFYIKKYFRNYFFIDFMVHENFIFFLESIQYLIQFTQLTSIWIKFIYLIKKNYVTISFINIHFIQMVAIIAYY